MRARVSIVIIVAAASAWLGAQVGRADDPDAGLPPPAALTGRTTQPTATSPTGRTTEPTSTSPTGRTTVPAGFSRPDVAGRYRVRGHHDARGFYAGRLDVTATPRGLRYTRSTRFDPNGVATIEQGSVELQSNGFVTQQDGRVHTDGAAAIVAGKPERVGTRRTVYRPFSRQHFEGDFIVEGVKGETGIEQIDKDAVAEDSFELLIDGRECFPRMRDELSRATRSISIEMYIVHGDESAWSIANILTAKARQGVEVRMLCDAIGVEKGGDKVLDAIKASGAQVIVQNHWYQGLGNSIVGLGRSLWNGIKSLFGGHSEPREDRGLFNHDHRKVIVIDGKAGLVGGMNFAHEYEFEWHDMQGRVEGPVVADLQAAFLDRWKAAGGAAPRDPSKLAFDLSSSQAPGDVKLGVLLATPGIKYEIQDAYLREIGRARKRILIENAYVLDDGVVSLLEQKARSGVPTTVIVPEDDKNDVQVVKSAFEWVENEVIRSGVDLRKYNGRMVHSKVATIDSTWSTIGSGNLDTLSLRRLCELNVDAHDPRVAKIFEERVFAYDVPASTKAAEKKLSWWQKIKSGVLHFFNSFI